jgi:hypothetical protein
MTSLNASIIEGVPALPVRQRKTLGASRAVLSVSVKIAASVRQFLRTPLPLRRVAAMRSCNKKLTRCSLILLMRLSRFRNSR